MSNKSKNHRKFLGASISTAVVASAVAPVMVPSAQANVQSFPDVQSTQFFYNAVTDLSNRNVINGFKDGTFRPYQTVTRAEAAKMLSLALGLEISNTKNSRFTDVKTSDWYYGYVSALVNAGIISGYEDKTFRPHETLTRAQMAKIITLGFSLDETSTDQFSDVKKEDWFASYVGSLVEKDITYGTTPTTFSPYKDITRGQIAAFIYRAEQAKDPISATYKIDSVTDSAVIINNVSYKLDDHVKSILNSANASILKNAIIQFDHSDETITKVKSLEITEAGESSKNPLVFDGSNGTIDGDLKVNADAIFVKNVTIKRNLELNEGVQSNYYGKNVTVEGQTIVAVGESKQSVNVNISSTIFQQASDEANNTSVTFEDSTLGTLEVKSEKTSLTVKGNTTIKELVVEDKNSKITVGKDSNISNITLPTGVEIEDIVENYNKIQSSIGKVNGKLTSSPFSGGGGGSLIKQAPVVAADTTNLEIGNDIELIFTDSEKWRNNVTTVEVDGTVLEASQYTITEGKVTLDKSLFTEEKSYTIVIKAKGYKNVTVNQTIQLNVVLDEIPGEITEAGIYGPETGTKTIEGSLVVKSSDVTLRNLIIEGDLIIDEAVGDGEVYLEGVEVKGTTMVKGGGENSIYFTDSVLVTVIVNKNDGKIRIVAQGNTTVSDLQLESYVRVEEKGLTGEAPGFTNVTLSEGIQNVDRNLQVTLEGTFDSVNSRASSVRIHLPESTSIEELVVSALATVSGTGQITTARINTNQVVLSERPRNMVIQIPNGSVTIGDETIDESYSDSEIQSTALTSIKAIQGSINLQYENFVAGITLDDFDILATLDGQPVTLENVSYNEVEHRITYNPISLTDNIGKELEISVTPKSNSTKVTGETQKSKVTIGTGFEGRITDIHGASVEGVKVKFKNQQDELKAEAVTDEFGYYSVSLDAGTYTAEIEGKGFIATYFLVVAPSDRYNLDQNSTAIRSASTSELKIMLSWNEYPRDVDSHLVGPVIGTTDNYRVWYGDKIFMKRGIVYADLDWDDTNSYGPETTTIRQLVDGTYTFVVHNYSGEYPLSQSGATVKIFKGNSKEADQTFTITAGVGNERYWKVFKLTVSNNGEDIAIEEINELSAERPEELEVGIAPPTAFDELESLLQDVRYTYNDVVEGAQAGQYAQGSKAIFQHAFQAAETVLYNSQSTEEDAEEALQVFREAYIQFSNSRLVEISESSLSYYFEQIEQLLASAVEGTEVGQYATGSKDKLAEVAEQARAAQGIITIKEYNETQEKLTNAINEFTSSQRINSEEHSLNSFVQEIQAAHDQAVEGTELGQYPAGSKAVLLEAINGAQQVLAQEDVSVGQLNNAQEALQEAYQDFLVSCIQNVVNYAEALLADVEAGQYPSYELDNLQGRIDEVKDAIANEFDSSYFEYKIPKLIAFIEYFESQELPTVTADDENNNIIGLDTTMEYKIDDGEYIQYDGTNAPELSGNHTVLVRIAATESSLAGAEATLTFTENQNTPTTEELKALTDAIAEAQSKYDSAIAGTEPGQYPQSAIDVFHTAILAADEVAKKADVTKEEVDKAVSDLATAESAFDGAKVSESALTLEPIKVQETSANHNQLAFDSHNAQVTVTFGQAVTGLVTVYLSDGVNKVTGTAEINNENKVVINDIDTSSLQDGVIQLQASLTVDGTEGEKVSGEPTTKDTVPPQAADITSASYENGTLEIDWNLADPSDIFEQMVYIVPAGTNKNGFRLDMRVYEIFEGSTTSVSIPNLTKDSLGNPITSGNYDVYVTTTDDHINDTLSEPYSVSVEVNQSETTSSNQAIDTEDTENTASFTATAYDANTNTLEISELINVETDSIFNLNKLTYSDGTETASTAALHGNYTLVTSLEEVDQPGEYFYNAETATLRVILVEEDAQGIEALSSFGPNGSVTDTLTANVGWNTDPANNEAATVVSNVGVTVSSQ